jgi:hypothetical protein
MKIYDAEQREMMRITSLSRDGSELIIRGMIFGSMPLTARLHPEDARAAFKLMGFKTFWFLLTLPFRRSRS